MPLNSDFVSTDVLFCVYFRLMREPRIPSPGKGSETLYTILHSPSRTSTLDYRQYTTKQIPSRAPPTPYR